MPETFRIGLTRENAMKKTVMRDEQIELMQTAEERHSVLIKRVLAGPLVRGVFSAPAPTEFQSAYTRTDPGSGRGFRKGISLLRGGTKPHPPPLLPL
jgi:hypothetical protein